MAGFEDLLPAELTSSRRGGPAPMRVAPPKPSNLSTASPTPPATRPAVDGVPDSVVDAWFQRADADGDGRVADSEAREFFLTSGLAAADLSKIWKLVKSPEVIAREGKGLSRHRFAQVLRLIALAQCADFPFTQDNATAALHSHSWLALHGVPLPPPHICGAEAQQQQQQRGPVAPASASGNPFGAADSSSARAAPAAATPAAAEPLSQQPPGGLAPQAAIQTGVAPAAEHAAVASPFDAVALPLLPGPSAAWDDDDDMFGLKALSARGQKASHNAAASSDAAGVAATAAQDGGTALAGAAAGSLQKAPSFERRLSRSFAVSNRAGSKPGIQRVLTGQLEPPVAFEARLPPLQPKVSAKLSILAAGNGCLFAGPAVGGGLLQWGRPEGNLRRPLDVDSKQAQQPKLGRLMSDLMYTYTAETHIASEDFDAAPAIEVTTSERGRTITCLLVDEPAQLLWVADNQGWVYALDIGGEPCMSLRAGHRLFNFQAHRVGYVTAMCRTPQGQLWTGASRGGIRVWELGEPALLGDAPEPPRCREVRKGFGERAHSGEVLELVCPADGQLVWSASAKGVLLWDSACGAFLGALLRTMGRPGSQAQLELLAGNNGGVADSAVLRYKVDGSKGLETDPITGYVLARPPSSDWPRIAADQEAWAAQSDNNINELMERVSIGGSRVVQGTGKALKLLGKLARGFGGAAPPPADTPKPAARAPSGTSLAASAAAAQGAADDEAAHAAADSSVSGVVAVVAPPGGSVWVVHKCGIVDRYTSAGRRASSDECGASITSAACIGQRVWIGFADGMISVREQDGSSVRVFQGHAAGILSIAQAGTRTYTLAADGSIKGWSSAVPHPTDLDALVSWDEQACQTYRRENLRVLCVTWNVGESKPEPSSAFFRWVHEAAFNTQLAVVGLQEIEMGSSSVALAAAKDAFSQKMQEKGNTNAKFWSSNVLAALGGERHWHQVGLRQLSGMLILVFARNHLKDSIGEVATSSVACGVLGVGGNKGAVAVEFSVRRRRIAIVCSHFAAHQGAVEARNANYTTICRQLTFSRRAWFADEEEAQAAAAAAKRKQAPGTNYALALEDVGDVDSDADGSTGPGSMDAASAAAITSAAVAAAAAAAPEDVVHGEGMQGADMLVWLGDFNYRIEGGYEAVKERAIRNELGPLLELDQCRREMAAGRVFRGLREGAVAFRPTYKFDKASANPFGYDTSEKRRIPAWCDRILFRGSKPFPTPEAEEGESLGAAEHEEDAVMVKALEYNCWADVTDSDHKPVYAVLEANLPITDQAKKRGICSQLLKECAAVALQGVEQAACSLLPEHIKLHPTAMPRQAVLLRNEGPQPLMFAVSQEAMAATAAGAGGRLSMDGRHSMDGDMAAAAVAQQLLEVRPVRGMVQPGQEQQLQVHLSDAWGVPGGEAPELAYQVHVGNQYSAGGESTAPGSTQLTFTATCLTSI